MGEEFVSFNLFLLKAMVSSDSKVFLSTTSTSLSHNNSIQSNEYNESSFTMNRESKNRAPVIPLTLNPKDYESNSDEGHDEEFPESKVSLHPNLKDYEEYEEMKNIHFSLILRII